MADINVINVGGVDYNVQDATSRTNINTALTITAYKEDGNTASQAYSVIGTPINWKGTLYYTKATIAAGATLSTSTNLTAATNLGKLVSNIKTYVNSNGELVFRDLRGADTVLPFKGASLEEGYVYFNFYWSSDGSNTKKVPLTNGTATFTGLGGGSGYAIPVAMSVMNTSNLSTVKISTSATVIFNVMGIKADGSIGYVTCINSLTYNVNVSDFEMIAFAHANNSSGYSMTITVS